MLRWGLLGQRVFKMREFDTEASGDGEKNMPKECCTVTWNKTQSDEPVFVIRGKDLLAGKAVRAWINSAEVAGVNPVKIESAREHLQAIETFQDEHPERCKIPD